ncbi:MAG: glycosyltransferase family 4 protein [Planctomycetia bacterium]|nr:glycosyltransferase family 4 protein [Planctomycetia bacterium]
MSSVVSTRGTVGRVTSSRRPRLCLLTQYFPPEMGAPQARLSELAERLVDLEWDIEVLTALPNYPTGAVFDGYDRQRPCKERVGRLQTIRVPLYTAKTGFTKRLRCYFSFVQSAKRHGIKLCQRPDLLFVESPPLFIGYAARYLARRWRCPYVLNVSDLWPASAVRMGVVRPGVATRLAERLELRMYREAVGVTGQSQEIIDSIQKRCVSTSVAVITNGVDVNRFGPQFADPAARALIGNEPGPVFIFAGLLGLAQGLDQLLDLAKSLPDDVPGRFVLVGDGPVREYLERRIAAESLHRVRLLPAKPRERIPALLACADVAIITLGYTIPGAVPSKIYEAMASALPILLVAPGEAARRVERAGAGLCVSPNATDELRAAFHQLATNTELRSRCGEAGRKAAHTEYNRDVIAGRLDQFLRGMLPSPVLLN